MKLLKKIALVLFVTAGLSSCVVYGPGPRYHHWHHHHWHGGYYGPR